VEFEQRRFAIVTGHRRKDEKERKGRRQKENMKKMKTNDKVMSKGKKKNMETERRSWGEK